jgi:oligopeptide/dipeptide ABC transporter ATP-binding protein
MGNIIEISELRMHFVFPGFFSTKLLKAIDGLSLEIREGESIGIVGESGSGKTTLAKCILGLYTPTSGEISFLGKKIFPPPKTRRRSAEKPQISIVFQDPYSSLNPKMTIYDILSEPLQQDRKEIARDVLVENLTRVGISGDYLFRYPHEFSGGQRQRIAIARALINNPAFLILDEPTSGLDVSVQAQILNLLLDIKTMHNLTYLFISHNLGVINYVCNRVAVMYRGRIVEIAPSERLIAHPCHPYTIRLLSAVPEMTGRTVVREQPADGLTDTEGEEEADTRCRYYGHCPERTERCGIEGPQWYSPEEDHSVLCARRTDS